MSFWETERYNKGDGSLHNITVSYGNRDLIDVRQSLIHPEISEEHHKVTAPEVDLIACQWSMSPVETPGLCKMDSANTDGHRRTISAGPYQTFHIPNPRPDSHQNAPEGNRLFGTPTQPRRMTLMEPSSSKAPPSRKSSEVKELFAEVPTIQRLQQIGEISLNRCALQDQLRWAQDVVRHLQKRTKADGHLLDRIIPIAVQIILSLASHRSNVISASALYTKHVLLNEGLVPRYLPYDPQGSLQHLEGAARGGESRAWFAWGKVCEESGDLERARWCFDNGAMMEEPQALCVSCLDIGILELP